MIENISNKSYELWKENQTFSISCLCRFSRYIHMHNSGCYKENCKLCIASIHHSLHYGRQKKNLTTITITLTLVVVTPPWNIHNQHYSYFRHHNYNYTWPRLNGHVRQELYVFCISLQCHATTKNTNNYRYNSSIWTKGYKFVSMYSMSLCMCVNPW